MSEIKDFSTEVMVIDNFGRPKVIHDGHQKIHLDLSSHSKPCPSCLAISYMEKGENWWVCPNQECGTLRFSKGWQEMRKDIGFLGQVKVNGWEYTHGAN